MSGNVSQTSDGHKRQCLGASVSHARGGGQARGSVLQSPSSHPAHPYASIDDLVGRVRDAPPREEVQFDPLDLTRAYWESRDLRSRKHTPLALFIGAFRITVELEHGDLGRCDPDDAMHRGDTFVTLEELVDFGKEHTMASMATLNLPIMLIDEEVRGKSPHVKLEGSSLSTALNALLGECSAQGIEAATRRVSSVFENLTIQSRLFFPILVCQHILLVEADFGNEVCRVYDDSQSRSYETKCKELIGILFQCVSNPHMQRVVSPANLQFVYGKAQETNACCIHALFNLVNCLADEPTRQALKDCNPSKHRGSVTLAIMSLMEKGYSLDVPKPSERK